MDNRTDKQTGDNSAEGADSERETRKKQILAILKDEKGLLNVHEDGRELVRASGMGHVTFFTFLHITVEEYEDGTWGVHVSYSGGASEYGFDLRRTFQKYDAMVEWLKKLPCGLIAGQINAMLAARGSEDPQKGQDARAKLAEIVSGL